MQPSAPERFGNQKSNERPPMYKYFGKSHGFYANLLTFGGPDSKHLNVGVDNTGAVGVGWEEVILKPRVCLDCNQRYDCSSR